MTTLLAYAATSVFWLVIGLKLGYRTGHDASLATMCTKPAKSAKPPTTDNKPRHPDLDTHLWAP